MVQDISPEYLADRYFEEVTSSEVRLQDARNMTFRADDIKIVDPTDVTKVLQFDLSGLTTATTRTIVAPDRAFTLGGGAGTRASVLGSSGNLTLTTAMSGSTMLFDVTGATAYTLPAVGASDVGVTFEFWWTASAAAAHSVTAAAADLLVGYAAMGVSGAGDVDYYFPNASTNLVMSVNGSTTGGVQGSRARFTCLSATRWGVEAHLVCTGTQATPFA